MSAVGARWSGTRGELGFEDLGSWRQLRNIARSWRGQKDIITQGTISSQLSERRSRLWMFCIPSWFRDNGTLDWSMLGGITSFVPCIVVDDIFILNGWLSVALGSSCRSEGGSVGGRGSVKGSVVF